MSPELEMLDQLLAGGMPLVVIRGLFDDGERFQRAAMAMLHAREVRLLVDGVEPPRWRWAEILTAAHDQEDSAGAWFEITEAGARRIV